MKLLIAIDASPASEVIADEITTRPWPEGVEARVLKVTDLFALAYGLPTSLQFPSAEMKASETIVKSFAEKLVARGIKTTTEIIEGYPPTAIVDRATQWGADFIIIGSHGHGRIAHFLLGSVARVVVRSAPCSVEIVRARKGEDGKPLQERKGMRIVLATDGSEFSTAAAQSVAERPWPEATEIKVVSVVDTVAPAIEPWYVTSGMMQGLREQATERAQETIKSTSRILSGAGLKTSEEALVGNPKPLIVEAAESWNADLIVVGSHGRRGVNRLLLGSVSEAVAMHAHCSVEIIRRRQRLY